MDGEHIRYANTSDGVGVAYTTLGEGHPLLLLTPAGVSSLNLALAPALQQRVYRGVARSRQLVLFDPRGTGLSERPPGPLTFDGLLRDVDAVVECLEAETVDLFAVSSAGPVALAFAARHPERVGRLVLWCTSAVGAEVQTPARRAIDSLLSQDWTLYTETYASAAFAWENADEARRLAALLRDSVTPEVRAAYHAVIAAADVRGELKQITAAALVVHMRDYRLVELASARRLASLLPRAELALFESAALFPRAADLDQVVKTIDLFLGGEDDHVELPAPADEPLPAAPELRTILFTDVAGSTALTRRLGDAGAREVMRQHERITRQALAAYGGAEVKTMGDGFMAAFASVSPALQCAIAVQQSFAAYNQIAGEPIRVRVGVNAGEPIAEGDDLFGTAVNLTARLAARAEGGQVLVSDVVRQLVAGKGFLFADRGEQLMRGFEDPVRVFELHWRE